jgi:hypothetical protein
MSSPIICLGQQPNGFFPKRYLYAKLLSARKLQQQIGGKIVFFYHDSDHDYRETITPLEDHTNHNVVRLNFTQANKWQKRFSPLYLKRIMPLWQQEYARKLPTFVSEELTEIFKRIQAQNVADFCLQMYRDMSLLIDIEVIKSGDPNFRQKALDLVDNYFVEVPYQGEIVRAKMIDGVLKLHSGGDNYIELPSQEFGKLHKSADRSSRFAWMQSVVRCSHYITGKSEQDYLDQKSFPEVTFVLRDEIEDQNMSLTEIVK